MSSSRLRFILIGLAAFAFGAAVLAALLAGKEQRPLALARTAPSCDRDFALTAGRAQVPGGDFTMGSEKFYPEEGPERPMAVAAFSMDRREVTNADFAEFVEATGYVTLAERMPDPADFPGVDAASLVPGSAVFVASETPGQAGQWRFVPGASWRAPLGPGSGIEGLEEHPVVHVTHEDAGAYAAWRGARLPTEAEWERAARAGREDAVYEWGAELAPDGQWRANSWQGAFPIADSGEDGFIGAAPAGCFEPSEYGLYDMTGNVWEWTADAYGGDPALGVVKGGSFLCADSYCARYRPPARQPYERNFSASHIGFRTVSD